VSKIVLLAVAAAWAAVLIPPLLRSRVDNRPNSSVSDFRRQLSSLERAVPTRTMVPIRGMARPLTQSPRQRQLPGAPAPLRRSSAGQRMHGASVAPVGDRHPNRVHREAHLQRLSQRELTRRRRTNVLLLLLVTNVTTLFLAATTKAHSLVYVFAIAFIALCGYCYKLVQLRSTELDRQYDGWFKAA
jgi:hypothetical protein